MIQARNIHKSFGQLEVLKGIDLDIHQGEVVSIVGKSGAGKTTLLHIMGTLELPDGSLKGSKGLKGLKVQQQAPLKLLKPLKPFKPLKPLKLNSHYMGLAASIIVVLGLSLFFSLSNRQQDTGCVAWVNGEKITDPTAVMALMQNTMRDIDIEGTNPVEDQLRDMFKMISL